MAEEKKEEEPRQLKWRWYCFVPGKPCTSDNPCDDMCGYVRSYW